MASVIKAGNATDGVQVTSDNTGILELKTGTGAGTTAVTVDTSQNVGIGTSSPADILHLSKAGDLYLRVANTSTGINAYLGQDSNGTYIGNTGASVVRFIQGASERMRLDTSGNLGLGVTPSTWGGVSGKALDFGAGSIFSTSTGTGQTRVISNAYYNTAWKYKATGGAAMYACDSGNIAHVWSIAASGSADANITFTQAMTLDASGSLQVTGNSTDATFSGSPGQFAIKRPGDSPYMSWHANNGSRIGYLQMQSGGVAALNVEVNQALFFATNATERVRIDASGYTQFSSNLVMPYQGAPTSKAAAATLSGAELITGILNTTGTTYTITLPTGANIEGALTWSANNVSLDWTVINTASGTITIGANGNTTLGSLTIATGTSAGFRIRRTAANTFTVYRMR